MAQSIGVGMIARNAGKTIKECIKSFAPHVNQVVVVLAGESTDKTAKEARKASPKVELYRFDWIDDFSAARNYSFSKLNTDWLLWVDADDIIHQAENLQKLADNADKEVGAIWFPYHYALDEFGNITTVYERERLLRASIGWIWQSRLHETVIPQTPCKHVRTDDVIFVHQHLAGEPRSERNFKLLNIMLEEDPEEKRIWLYLGHQNFAARNWLESSKWYMKFGTDAGALLIERYQALCYCSKAMREMNDPQAVDVALMAVEMFPAYRDGYLELAHSYNLTGNLDKALHWSQISKTKDIIRESPRIIFVNPLEASFNRPCLEADCYLKLGEPQKALEGLSEAYKVRPTEDLAAHIQRVKMVTERDTIDRSIKTIFAHLLRNKEMTKLKSMLNIVPYWFKDLPMYSELKGAVDHYNEQLTTKPVLKPQGKCMEVDVSNVVDIPGLLKELDRDYDKVTFFCTLPSEDSQQINVLSLQDAKEIVTSQEGRHIINLQLSESRVTCEYDRKPPQDLAVRIFCGRGLEGWNPMTIKEVGCGGSETAAAYIAKELAKRDCQPIVYAMDSQVWDGVVYMPFNYFRPDSILCHLFISSRVPDVFLTPIPAKQKWLWFHDIHRWDRFTPEVASEIDVLLVLSQWHANFIRATYPFMKDAEMIDFDNNKLPYNDCIAPDVWFEDATLIKLPKIAIIGNGLDTERFEEITEERIPHRFIWNSSPDRGLEQVLSLWQKIKTQLPKAELKIFYGWDYFNSATHIPSYREFKEKIRMMLKQDGVEWCGRIGQDQLAKELMKADIMLYPPPHDFRETYGIAFLEAQAAGVLCFYRMNGALGETIGNRGIPLKLDATEDEIVDIIVQTLHNEKRCDNLRKRAREYALKRSWGRQTEKILELYRKVGNG